MLTCCSENEPAFAVVTRPRGQALFVRGYNAGAGDETGHILHEASGWKPVGREWACLRLPLGDRREPWLS